MDNVTSGEHMEEAGLIELIKLDPTCQDSTYDSQEPILIEGSFYSVSYFNSARGVKVEIVNVSALDEDSLIKKIDLKCPLKDRCAMDSNGAFVDSLAIVRQPYALVGLSPNAPFPIKLR